MEIETYEEWEALSIEQKRDYAIEILKQVKFDEDNNATNLKYWGNGTGEWKKTTTTKVIVTVFHRIIPELKYIPFTHETIKPHADRWIKYKSDRTECKIIRIQDKGIRIDNDNTSFYTYELAFEVFEFIDLSTGKTEPFGELVNA